MANFNFNKVILGGRLTEAPELKATSNGTVYTPFSIAENGPKNKQGESKTNFIRCIAWKQRAELIARCFNKGSSICIVGHIETQKYTDQNGNSRETTDIVVDEVVFVDSKQEAQKTAEGESAGRDPEFTEIEDDEDLPF